MSKRTREESDDFGKTSSGAAVCRHTLTSGTLQVQVIDLGATITSVTVPDKTGVVGEVTLGFDSALPYSDGTSRYFGCVAGRYANRIAKGKFTLDGKEFSGLAKNNNGNSLHGGLVGFDKQVWSLAAKSDASVTFSLSSADGDEGFPGTLTARVTYSLPSPTELRIEYQASVTGATTVCNLTNHSYWNLADGGATTVLDHEVSIAADFYTPVDAEAIPTGEVKAVHGPMDLRKPVSIGAGHVAADTHAGLGYDHNFCLSAPLETDGLRPVARVVCPRSGRTMSVRSDQPGVQFYSGNFLDNVPGRKTYAKHAGFCLETQRFPDSPNNPQFPSTILRPEETYTHTTVHTFGVVE